MSKHGFKVGDRVRLTANAAATFGGVSVHRVLEVDEERPPFCVRCLYSMRGRMVACGGWFGPSQLERVEPKPVVTPSGLTFRPGDRVRVRPDAVRAWTPSSPGTVESIEGGRITVRHDCGVLSDHGDLSVLMHVSSDDSPVARREFNEPEQPDTPDPIVVGDWVQINAGPHKGALVQVAAAVISEGVMAVVSDAFAGRRHVDVTQLSELGPLRGSTSDPYADSRARDACPEVEELRRRFDAACATVGELQERVELLAAQLESNDLESAAEAMRKVAVDQLWAGSSALGAFLDRYRKGGR